MLDSSLEDEKHKNLCCLSMCDGKVRIRCCLNMYYFRQKRKNTCIAWTNLIDRNANMVCIHISLDEYVLNCTHFPLCILPQLFILQHIYNHIHIFVSVHEQNNANVNRIQIKKNPINKYTKKTNIQLCCDNQTSILARSRNALLL